MRISVKMMKGRGGGRKGSRGDSRLMDINVWNRRCRNKGEG